MNGYTFTLLTSMCGTVASDRLRRRVIKYAVHICIANCATKFMTRGMPH